MEGARREAKRLNAVAQSIESRKHQSKSNKRLAMFLRGKARVLKSLSDPSSGNPLRKSSGDYQGIRSVEDYLALIKKVRSIQTWNQLGAVLHIQMEKQPRVTQAFIPKAGCKGGLRPLGIPPHWVKAFEYWYLPLLDSVRKSLERGLTLSYAGFGQGESAVEQAKRMAEMSKGSFNYIALDQSGAFDAMNQAGRDEAYSLIPEYARKQIKELTERRRSIGGYDRAISVLDKEVKQWMDGEDMVFFKKPGKASQLWADRGTPQGGVTSPQMFMLAQGICYANATRRLEQEGIKITGIVYADDAVIGISGGIEEVVRTKDVLAEEFAVYGLQMNLDKSEIVRNGEDIRLLGFKVNKGEIRLDREHINSRISSKWQSEVADVLERVYATTEGSQEEREAYESLMDKINRKPCRYAPGIARLIGYIRYYIGGRKNAKEWLKELSNGMMGREGKTYRQFQECRGKDMGYKAYLLRETQKGTSAIEKLQVILGDQWKATKTKEAIKQGIQNHMLIVDETLPLATSTFSEDISKYLDQEEYEFLATLPPTTTEKSEVDKVKVIPLVENLPSHYDNGEAANFISVSDWMTNLL